MIDKYSAYSANERTFLAWVRTAIAIVGFGILIDRLDASMGGKTEPIVTLILIGLGGLLIIFSALRFEAINKRIAAETSEPAYSWRFDIVFAITNVTLVFLLVAFALHIL